MNQVKQKNDEAIKNLRSINGLSSAEVFLRLKTKGSGLSDAEVFRRRLRHGYNEVAENKKGLIIKEILDKIASPLIITLIIVAIFSFFFGQRFNAVVVILMALLGVILSFVQEFKAQKTAKKLRTMVRLFTQVKRQGNFKAVPFRELVIGDIIKLSAGDMVPADIRIISGKDLFISQSALNGESFPVERWPERQNLEAENIYELDTIACMGSSIVSGMAEAVVVGTGADTQFGQLSRQLASLEPETAFDKGIRQFTWLMIRFIFVLVIFIFLVNTFLRGNFVESLLFALAIAVGLTPEMLPMITTVNLSRGALNMSKKMVIIKRLDAIQNIGAIDILCTDKTGTLTLDKITLVKHCDIEGKENEKILKYAYINSASQTGLANLLDNAVMEHKKFDLQHIKKIDEIPFDFTRRIMSVVVEMAGQKKIISKGAPEEIFKRSCCYELDGKKYKIDRAKLKILNKVYDDFSREGFRVLGIAYSDLSKSKAAYSQKDEADLVFMGFIAFFDPPKPTAKKAIDDLELLGVKLKILSGDNEAVTEKICLDVGIPDAGAITGSQIEDIDDAELKKVVEEKTVFARLLPLQKERVIKILKENNHVVGFLGDGINDAPALRAADVGISVDNAADIAKDTADIILLRKSLTILSDCVREGRKTFANTLKYIKMGASSNFGNMLSMTAASFFLPFLPMLPAQILLNNFLYDLSQMTIPTDKVDNDYLLSPRPWDISFIKKFILFLGPVSSIFDFLTFGVMWYVFSASPELFRTGWFVESLFTQTLIIFVIRTNKIPFLQSRPGKLLTISVLSMVLIGCLLPFSPLAEYFQFVPLPPLFFLILLGIGVAYLSLTEIIKRWFIKLFGYQ